MILCDGDTLSIDESWLPREATRHPATPLGDLAQRERAIFEDALAKSNGRVAGPLGAAALLGIAPSTLESKIRKLRLNKARFKSV